MATLSLRRYCRIDSVVVLFCCLDNNVSVYSEKVITFIHIIMLKKVITFYIMYIWEVIV